MKNSLLVQRKTKLLARSCHLLELKVQKKLVVL